MIPSIAGRNQPKIDCMFFPATKGDKVVIEPTMTSNSEEDDLKEEIYDLSTRKYLDKSTIIMCNPNALIYQWMITSVNAYWLDFFLRRDANVFIWNYRGYGDSEQSMFSPNHDPNQQRVDVERVLQFLVNKIRVKGSIGVYGRSIGGIPASHLLNKFPNLIKVYIGDRTMGNFDDFVQNRYPGGSKYVLKLYKIGSCRWRVDNAAGLCTADTCFKIICADPNDDMVD